jgi:hypothetical protein
MKEGLSTIGILAVSLEIGRKRDEQSNLCSRDRGKYETRARNFMMILVRRVNI